MIDMTTALQHLLDATRPLESEPCDLRRALHRVTCESVRARWDAPPFTKSLVDGFAIRSQDLRDTSSNFSVVGQRTAGSNETLSIGAYQTVRIMTGAQVPPGADAVIMQENSQTVSDPGNQLPNDELEGTDATLRFPQVALRGPAREGLNLLRQASIYRLGDVVIPVGHYLRAAEIGLLAEIGREVVEVCRMPQIGVLTTGDELVELGQPLSPGRIHNSNGPMIAALCREVEATPHELGIVHDDQTKIESIVRSALDQFDMVLISGGVSVGTKDFIPDALEACGVRRVFHGVNMKPGKPLWFGVYDRTSPEDPTRRCLVLGLPGNPLAVFAGFQLFARTAILIMRGFPPISFGDEPDHGVGSVNPQVHPLRHHPLGKTPHTAKLAAEYRSSFDRPTWVPCRWLAKGSSSDEIDLVEWCGSADLLSLASAEGLALFPTDVTYNAGTPVKVLRW
ncbi:MAG: molybdopterin molybdotransferase MoeA [Planctomycetota bacterium]|nr:molybdopterin molybdotransferase MoeA [Planctomycetota bacterium]MDA1179377.1 molybdopterin molybdotransferase MoeA [Planctomycetota bacterium]